MSKKAASLSERSIVSMHFRVSRNINLKLTILSEHISKMEDRVVNMTDIVRRGVNRQWNELMSTNPEIKSELERLDNIHKGKESENSKESNGNNDRINGTINL